MPKSGGFIVALLLTAFNLAAQAPGLRSASSRSSSPTRNIRNNPNGSPHVRDDQDGLADFESFGIRLPGHSRYIGRRIEDGLVAEILARDFERYD
jgi:hypothetical protein